ncbi:replication initiator protein, partial [Salmonella enterica subsp. enterica]|nr:replication initiator protein [Salmonella enterica subsp. enterica serovar Bovismorbificans]EEO7693739.1 replication initiator protein [Salmonella enterica subsp. enterica serovar Bovismorbificans]
DKFITTDYLQQCPGCYGRLTRWKGGGDVVYMALL